MKFLGGGEDEMPAWGEEGAGALTTWIGFSNGFELGFCEWAASAAAAVS